MGEVTDSLGGGQVVRVSTLVVGDTIRDPKRRKQILIVEDTGNPVFARGLARGETSRHVFLDVNSSVEKVTNATTENSVL